MPTPLDPFAGLLADLREQGSIPHSRVRGKSSDRLLPLLHADVLQAVRVGAGRAIVVRNPEALRAFIDKQYPAGLMHPEGADEEDFDRRTFALSRHRNTKAMGGLDFEIVEFRLTGKLPLQIGHRLVFGSGTPGGFGAFVLHDRRHDAFPLPVFNGRVASCENPTVFIADAPWKNDSIDLVIATYGRMSRRLVAWLSSPIMSGSTITHYGDYDPVGLSEFLRLNSAMGERASLFLPDNLEELFHTYQQRDLLAASSRLLPKLAGSAHPGVQRVLSLMQEYAGGLEHEALLTGYPLKGRL